MSTEKYRAEAGRWLAQAKADLRAADASVRSGCCEWACFQAQQAGDKGLKAFWYGHAHDPWGHSLLALIRDYPDEPQREALRAFEDQAKQLDKLYIPTRFRGAHPHVRGFVATIFTCSSRRQSGRRWAIESFCDDSAPSMVKVALRRLPKNMMGIPANYATARMASAVHPLTIFRNRV